MKKRPTKKPTKKRPCPSCGLAFIKGRYVWRVLGDGPVRQRVCQGCAALAVPILASDAAARCQQCGKNLARYCPGCITEVFEASHGKGMVEMLASAALARGGKRKRVRSGE